ncbi:hypothetical protein Tco_0011484 [Tanacetum coccineum]
MVIELYRILRGYQSAIKLGSFIMRPLRMAYRRVVASDDLRDALSVIFGLSELKELEEVIKDQLLPVDASPIALSSDYISDSDPEEDDEEDPERSSLTISAERRDNDDNESSNDDDDDDDVKDEEDEEEEEHLAPADPSAIPTGDPLHTISSCFLRPNPVQYGCLFNTILHYHHLPKQYEVGWYFLNTIMNNNSQEQEAKYWQGLHCRARGEETL